MPPIPLDHAHEILSIFGITSPSAEYQRTVQEYGFDHEDFSPVLHQSEFIYWFDQRGALHDFLEYFQEILSEFDAEFSFTMHHSSEQAHIQLNEDSTSLHYHPDEHDEFIRDVVEKLAHILPSELQLRQWKYNQGSDTIGIALIPKDDWETVENLAEEFFEDQWLPVLD